MAVFDHSVNYRGSSPFRWPHRVRLRRLESILSGLEVAPGRYADVGCSNGFVTAQAASWLDAREAVGFDRHGEHLERGRRQHPGIRFESVDLNDPPTVSAPFDVVSCFQTLEHVGSVPDVVRWLFELAGREGVVVISVPVETGPWGVLKLGARCTVLRRRRQLDEVLRPDARWRDVLTYARAVLAGRRLGPWREPARRSWSSHYGFDHRDVAEELARQGAPVHDERCGSTRIFVIDRRPAAGVSARASAAPAGRARRGRSRGW